MTAIDRLPARGGLVLQCSFPDSQRRPHGGIKAEPIVKFTIGLLKRTTPPWHSSACGGSSPPRLTGIEFELGRMGQASFRADYLMFRIQSEPCWFPTGVHSPAPVNDQIFCAMNRIARGTGFA